MLPGLLSVAPAGSLGRTRRIERRLLLRYLLILDAGARRVLNFHLVVLFLEALHRRLTRRAARHRVWQRRSETATRLRPCGAGWQGTDARLGPSTGPLSGADEDAQGR